jgi:hypothetical protein
MNKKEAGGSATMDACALPDHQVTRARASGVSNLAPLAF